MKNKAFAAILLIVAMLLVGCGSSLKNDSTEAITQELGTPSCTEVVITCPPLSDDMTFADSLMLLTASDGNRMLSPYSAKMCLAMLANGAKGETKEQILNAIGIDDLDAYNAFAKDTLKRYDSYAGILSLNTANSLWINQSVLGADAKFLPDYRSRMQEHFNAQSFEVTSDNSIESVNAWAKEKTNGKIDSILSEDHREFALALANAVYFKAAWTTPFDKYLTEEDDFFNIDGSVSKLDFMNVTDSFGYYESEGIRALELEYGRFGTDEDGNFILADKNYSFSMYLMLCDGDLNIESFLNDFAPFERKTVHASVPKFELNYSVQMNDILKALGMENAFDDRADLSGLIGRGGLVVSDVLQKTYIKIDEEGTEAAAVTAITANESCALPSDPPIEIKFDKPFYFAIRDNTSGELLFVGRYEKGE